MCNMQLKVHLIILYVTPVLPYYKITVWAGKSVLIVCINVWPLHVGGTEKTVHNNVMSIIM